MDNHSSPANTYSTQVNQQKEVDVTLNRVKLNTPITQSTVNNSSNACACWVWKETNKKKI